MFGLPGSARLPQAPELPAHLKPKRPKDRMNEALEQLGSDYRVKTGDDITESLAHAMETVARRQSELETRVGMLESLMVV